MIEKLIINRGAIERFEKDKRIWLSKGLEDGKYIFGKIYSNGVAEVTHILSTPNAERSPISFSGDNEYATEILNKLRKNNPDLTIIGEYHLHPWHGNASLSYQDVSQLLRVKQEIPWYIAILATADDFKIFDIDPKNESRIREVDYQVVDTKHFGRGILLDRIKEIVKSEELIDKSVLIIGLGSGGSVIAKYLACTGVGRLILVDNDRLEVANVIRHEGTIDDVGKRKTEICRKIVESHNPYIVVKTYDFDITKKIEQIKEIIAKVDLIIDSSGNPTVNGIVNKLSLELNKKAIYGGVFERALGAYVLAVKPNETACLNCLFGLASQYQNIEEEKREELPCPGVAEEELHRQQGVWVDVSFPALILSKMALAMLQGEDLNYNLILYDSSLEIRKIRLERRKDCSICNRQSWARSLMQPSMKEKFYSFLRRLKFWKR